MKAIEELTSKSGPRSENAVLQHSKAAHDGAKSSRGTMVDRLRRFGEPCRVEFKTIRLQV
jgi:hypothetical protein